MNDFRNLKPASDSDADLRAFVTTLYHGILERQPDPVGLNAHVTAMRKGTRPSQVVDAFLTCPEYLQGVGKEVAARAAAAAAAAEEAAMKLFPIDYHPPGEAGRCYVERVRSGFFRKYCSGPVVLDVGFSGYNNPEGKAALPHAIGIDLDYPGYDGVHLPFDDGSVDTVFSSHCLEHIADQHGAIRDWFRVLRVGGFIVCMVPSQALYEKKRELPSRWNQDHKRMYSPARLAEAFETALVVNSYRLRHLIENDFLYDYERMPDQHPDGAYEIELVVEKIDPPAWELT